MDGNIKLKVAHGDVEGSQVAMATAGYLHLLPPSGPPYAYPAYLAWMAQRLASSNRPIR